VVGEPGAIAVEPSVPFGNGKDVVLISHASVVFCFNASSDEGR
jgi:hypothetical protein